MTGQDPQEIEQLIRARAGVDAQLLLLAKTHLIEHCAGEGQTFWRRPA